MRPFGTGTSCIDTVYGECVENVSLENCMERCNDSQYCHYGLYIEPKNSEKKYCLPLISKGGQNINGNLIFNKNNSKLSEITTFFMTVDILKLMKNYQKISCFWVHRLVWN